MKARHLDSATSLVFNKVRVPSLADKHSVRRPPLPQASLEIILYGLNAFLEPLHTPLPSLCAMDHTYFYKTQRKFDYFDCLTIDLS